MNRPPLPSFFKIRLSIIVLVFVVFIFLIGVAKQALAIEGCESGQCYAWYWNITYKWDNRGYPIDISPLDTCGVPSAGTQQMGATGSYPVISVTRFHWNGANWQSDIYMSRQSWPGDDATITSYFNERGVPKDTYPSSYWPTGPPEDCGIIDPCQEERDELESRCGAGNYYLDEETCEGDCKCNDNDEDGICNACDLDPNDPEITNVAWVHYYAKDADGSVCEKGYVLKRDDFFHLDTAQYYTVKKPGGCSQAYTPYIHQFPNREPIKKNCTSEDCNVCDGGAGDIPLIPGGITTTNPNTPQPDTEEKTNQCRDHCYPKSYMYVPGSDQCICIDSDGANDNQNDPDPTDPTSQPTEDPTAPETGSPNEDPGEGSTDNKLLKSIDENTRATTQNTKSIAEGQAKTNQLLEWVGKNAEATAGNTAKIENSVDGLGNKIDGLGDKVDGLGDQIGEDLGQLGDDLGEKLDELTDELAGENEPTEELPDETPEPYSVDDHDWGARTTQFLSDMRSTGLFSVPTDFFDAVPGGGSPEITINGGETYGVHTLSFADYSSGLIAIRTVIQLAFMWLAIRIVTLKR